MSKNTKRFLCITLIMMMSVSLFLSGCGKSADDTQTTDAVTTAANTAAKTDAAETTTQPENSYKIRLMTRWTGADSNAPALQQALAAFKEEYPNIEIVDESIADGDAYDNKISVQIATGTPPHIFQTWTPVDYAKNEVLLDMTRYYDEDPAWRDGFVGGVIDAVGKFPGLDGLYVVPMEVNYEPMYYNVDLFKKAGIDKAPETWDEFIADIGKLNAAGITPIGTGAKDSWRLSHILNGICAKSIGAEKIRGIGSGQTKFTDPEVLNAFKMLKQLVDVKAFDKNMMGLDFATETTNFLAEKCAMTYNGTWFVGNVEGSAIKDKISTFLMPVINEEGKTTDVLYSGGFSLSNYIKDEGEKAAMITAIKYLSGPESAAVFYNTAKRPIPRNDVTIDVNMSKLLAGVIEQEKAITAGIDFGANINNQAVSDLLGSITQAIVLGAKTPEEAVKMLQAEMDKK